MLLPLVLLFLAAAMILIGARGQAANAAALLSSEFVGKNSFLPWLVAILLLGVVGYWKPARPFADAFIGLVLLSIFLKDGQGFFAQLQSALGTKPAPRQNVSGGAQGSTSSNAPGAQANAAAQAAETAAADLGKTILFPLPPEGGSISATAPTATMAF